MTWHSSSWNAGKLCGCAQVVLALAACLGYIIAKDSRRALYWLFVACIEATVTL